MREMRPTKNGGLMTNSLENFSSNHRFLGGISVVLPSHLSCFTWSSQCFDTINRQCYSFYQAVFSISLFKSEIQSSILRFQLLWMASSE